MCEKKRKIIKKKFLVCPKSLKESFEICYVTFYSFTYVIVYVFFNCDWYFYTPMFFYCAKHAINICEEVIFIEQTLYYANKFTMFLTILFSCIFILLFFKTRTWFDFFVQYEISIKIDGSTFLLFAVWNLVWNLSILEFMKIKTTEEIFLNETGLL